MGNNNSVQTPFDHRKTFMNNTYCKGTVDQKIQTSDSSACLSECVNDELCQQWVYNGNTKSCELHNKQGFCYPSTGYTSGYISANIRNQKPSTVIPGYLPSGSAAPALQPVQPESQWSNIEAKLKSGVESVAQSIKSTVSPWFSGLFNPQGSQNPQPATQYVPAQSTIESYTGIHSQSGVPQPAPLQSIRYSTF